MIFFFTIDVISKTSSCLLIYLFSPSCSNWLLGCINSRDFVAEADQHSVYFSWHDVISDKHQSSVVSGTWQSWSCCTSLSRYQVTGTFNLLWAKTFQGRFDSEWSYIYPPSVCSLSLSLSCSVFAPYGAKATASRSSSSHFNQLAQGHFTPLHALSLIIVYSAWDGAFL